MTPNNTIANALRRHQVNVFRFAQHLNGDVQERIVGVRGQLVTLVAAGDPTEPTRLGDKLNRIDGDGGIADQAENIISSTYDTINDTNTSGIVDWAGDEQDVVARVITKTAGIAEIQTVPTRVLERIVDRALIQGAPSADWWAKQASDLTDKFAAAVREDTKSGKSLADIVTRVRGTGPSYADSIIRVSQANAESLVRSSVLSALHDTRMEEFRRNADVVEGWSVLTTFDRRTCPICMGFSGATYDMDGNPLPSSPVQRRLPSDGLPIHFSCRCCASVALIGEAPPDDLDFESWLKGESEASQKEVLGEQWWSLWKDGTLQSLQDRVDQRGRPLSLEQFREQNGLKEAA